MSFSASFPIDFNGFTASGFQPVPAPGQLDSDFWRIQGFSDNAGLLDYGATITTAGDYARGILAGDPTIAGLYAANTGLAGVGTAFIIQPTGAEFGTTPGTITLRVQYTGTTSLSAFTFDYDGIYRNNADRSVAVNLAYAVAATDTQPTSFSDNIAGLGFTTPLALTAGANWSQLDLTAQTINATVNPNDYIFLRWQIGDNGGTGSRDEVGIDNILLSTGGGGGGGGTPTISLSPTTISLAEGNSGSTAYTYSIARSAIAPGDAAVSITITGGQNFNLTDIASVTLGGVAISGFALGTPFTATLAGAATSTALVVNIAGDTTIEADEGFTVALSNAAAGYTLGTATATGTVLDDDNTTTAISTIQGSGTASPLIGNTVTIQGVVTGDYQNGDGDAARNLQGFFVQMISGDGNPLTSDGIFIYQTDGATTPGTNVNIGDIVRVTGVVTEAYNQTELVVGNSATGINIVTAGAYTSAQVISNFAVDVNLPANGTITAGGRVLPNLEAYEGMLIRLPQSMTITEMYNLDRYGEVRVAQGGQATQFTQTNAPSVAGYNAYLNELGARSLLIDDGLNVQNPNPVTFLGNTLATATAPQIGDSFSGLVGNLGYDFNEYRLQAANSPVIIDTQPRTAAPGRADGDLKLVSTNLLNYFATLDTGTTATTGPNNAFEPRGANNAAEFARQSQKLYTALTQLDGDLIVVNEMENNGFGAGSAIKTLVDGFNASLGTPGRWSYVDPGITYLGGDAIKVSILYRTDKLAIATGSTVQVLDDTDIPGLITAKLLPANFLAQSSMGAVFNGTNTSRAVLVTSFQEIGSGEAFTVAAIHNKSKSGTGTGLDADQGDGAGNWNNQRLLATQALDAFLKTNPTGINDPDKIIMGDFNSYAQELSMKNLTNSGYSNLIQDFIGNDKAASYVFDGQKGYLDAAFSSQSLKPYIRTVDEWRLNSPEADGIDYNTDFSRPTNIFDGTLPNRYSDHDPVVVNLKLDPALLLSRGGATVDVGDDIANLSLGAQAGDTITIRKPAGINDGPSATIKHSDVTIDAPGGYNGVFVLADGQTNLGSKGLGNITLNGNSGANILTGNSGDNQFTGGAGDDTMDGGTGNDTASFSGSQGQYRFGVRDAALTLSGPDGRDHLVNVEFVKFGTAATISMASLKSTTADQGLVLVNRNGSDSYELPDLYTGPVAGLQNQFLGSGQKEIVLGTDKADAINALGGDDAVDGGAGNDVIDGGLGSNFLTGGAGLDQFFLDGRGAATGNTWSTITDWQAGETLTIFGYKPGISALLRLASDGTAGFKGATLHADLDGNGLIDTSITWAGITQAQLPAVQFGADYIFFG